LPEQLVSLGDWQPPVGTKWPKHVRKTADGYVAPRHLLLDIADQIRLGPEVEHAIHVVTSGLTTRQLRQRLTPDERPVPDLGPERVPYPYQVDGFRFLMRCGSGLLTDEPGLGKTLQGILLAFALQGRTLIVGPSSAKGVWQEELKKCRVPESEVQVIDGRKPRATTAKFVIINYDILAYHALSLGKEGFTTLLLDEAHRAKDVTNKTTKAVVHIAGTVRHKFFLTGTPILNSAADLYPALHILRPEDFPDLISFQKRYCKWKMITLPDGSRREVPYESNPLMLPELKERLRPWMIHRKLSDIKTQLPEVRYSTITIDLPSEVRKSYDALRKDAVTYWKGLGDEDKAHAAIRGGALAISNDLLGMTVAPKAVAAKDFIETFLTASEDRKLLVFGSRHLGLDLIQAHNPDAVRIDGNTPSGKRSDIQKAFQNPTGPRLFIGQINACGEALTLDRADTVLFLESDWSPARNFQAERRALRGNTEHHLHVATMVARDTIDEARQRVLARKAETARDLLAADDEGDVLQETLREEFGVHA
jgi:SWI/SNF-related matrix-associated actin-dependent regulator 1 of chromatin subfamily A